MSTQLDAIISRAEAEEATPKDGYTLLEIMQQEVDRLGEIIAQIESGTFPTYTHKIMEPEDRHGT